MRSRIGIVKERERERSRIIDLKPEVCLVRLLRHRPVRKGKRALLLLWDLAMALCCWDGCSWVLPRRTWKRELSLEAPPPSLPCPRLSRALFLSLALPRAFFFLLWMWKAGSLNERSKMEWKEKSRALVLLLLSKWTCKHPVHRGSNTLFRSRVHVVALCNDGRRTRKNKYRSSDRCITVWCVAPSSKCVWWGPPSQISTRDQSIRQLKFHLKSLIQWILWVPGLMASSDFENVGPHLWILQLIYESNSSWVLLGCFSS